MTDISKRCFPTCREQENTRQHSEGKSAKSPRKKIFLFFN